VPVPILEDHEAKYVPGDIATLKPGQFLSEVEWLHSHGFHTINFGQLYAAMYHGYQLPPRPVLLSFDDGYESVYFKVFPILKQYHDQATLFIVSGFTHDQPDRNKPFPTLTTSELQEMQQSGLVDIEDHTMTHHDLSTLSDAAAKQEVEGSAQILQQIVHHPMEFFCYPDGGYSERTVSFVQAAGYLLAVTQHQSYANPSQGPLLLHRLTILDTTTLQDFADKLQASLASGAVQTPTSPAQSPSSSQPSGTVATPASIQANLTYQQGAQAFSKRDYATAIQLEQKVVQADPTFYQAYNVEGIALCFAGQYSAGMDNIDKSLQLNPVYGYARFNKALGLELYAHYDEAIQEYKQAIALNTKDWWVAWSYYGIASIYGRRGDVTQTVQYLNQAIKINPETKSAARTERDFDNVRSSSEFQALVQ